jgi:hypothetical protein
MANWRKSRFPGVYVAHSKSCPAFADPDARCRCKPSWRGRRWDSAARKPVWGKTTKDRSEVLVWLAAAAKGTDHLAELANRGPTFGALGEEWLDGVERGRIGRRRGKGKPYSDTTIASMRRRWQYKVRPEFGDRFAGELTEMDWQRWIAQLARQASPAPLSLSSSRSHQASTRGHPHRAAGSSTSPTRRHSRPAHAPGVRPRMAPSAAALCGDAGLHAR